MNTIFNPKTSTRVFGGLMSLMGLGMIVGAHSISSSAFSNISQESIQIATWMHEVFGAANFAFGFFLQSAWINS